MAKFVKVGRWYLNLDLLAVVEVMGERDGTASYLRVAVHGMEDMIAFQNDEATEFMEHFTRLISDRMRHE